MKIGLIDVDGHNFPNLPLMKLSAWHKAQGDTVEWYEPMFSGHMDKVYLSKVFSFTPDYDYYIDADEVVKGGSGYCISLVNGIEEFDKSKHFDLPYEIEHVYPDYSIYYDKIPEVRDTAYGFLTRGCQCDCDFCHVAQKEGKCSVKVANLSEFWMGQKNIVLLDPNKYEDKDIVVPKFKQFKEITQWDKRKLSVYVLTNFNTTHEQDLERIYTLRELGYWPYVMIYDKEHLPKGHITRRLQRWVNMRAVFETTPRFEDYLAN